jgi:hypothetical protein
MAIFSQYVDGSHFELVELWNNAGTLTWYFTIWNGSSLVSVAQACSPALSTNTWYHVAFIRNGSAWRIYQGGVQLGSDVSASITAPDFAAVAHVGMYGTSYNHGLNGYIKELRVSKGIARWTTNFSGSLPTMEYTSDVPSVTAFTIPSTSATRNISISSFTGTDDVGVTGYIITDNSTTPTEGDSRWAGSAQTAYNCYRDGSVTLYAWVRDADGQISSYASATTTVSTLTPVVYTFTVPDLAIGLTVPILEFFALEPWVWARPLGSNDGTEHSVIASSKVYVSAYKGSSGAGGVYVLDLATGIILDGPYQTSNWFACSPIPYNGYIYAYDSPGTSLFMIQESNGTVAHSVTGLSNLNLETCGWDTSNNRIIVPTSAGLKAYSLTDLSLVHSNTDTSCGAGQIGTSILVVGSYIYYKPPGVGTCYQLNLSDLSTAASVGSLGYSTNTYVGPVYDTDRNWIYVQGADAQVHAIRVSDMSIQWSKTITGTGMTTPRIQNALGYYNGKVFAVVDEISGGSYASKLYALDPTNSGNVLWTNADMYNAGEAYGKMAIVGGYILAATVNNSNTALGHLYIIDINTGVTKANIALTNGCTCGGVTAISGGLVIINEHGGYVEGMNLGSGPAGDCPYYMENIDHNGYSGLTFAWGTGISKYLVNESASTPSKTDAGWSATPQTSYTFGSTGSKTLYAWVKDASGNISLSKSAPVVVVAGLADTITLSDSYTNTKIKALSDTITLSDSYSKVWTAKLSEADSISLSDSASKTPAKSFSESISLSDVFSRVWTGLVSLSDSIALSELLGKTVSVSKADVISLSDSLTKLYSLLKADGISLSDIFSYFRGMTYAASDTINLSDSISKTPDLSRADSFTLSDLLSKAVSLSKADAVTLTDSARIASSFVRALSDFISLSDALVKKYGLSEADNLTLSDALSKLYALTKSDTISLIDLAVCVRKVLHVLSDFQYQQLKSSAKIEPGGDFSYDKLK